MGLDSGAGIAPGCSSDSIDVAGLDDGKWLGLGSRSGVQVARESVPSSSRRTLKA